MSERPSSTSAGTDTLFGVHIPELQLDDDSFRGGMRAAGLARGERYLELGSGHGRGLVIAAREFGATSTGVEYLPDAIERSRTLASAAGVAHAVTVIHGDVERADVTDADVVHMHLGPAFHDVLAGRLERLLARDARVIAAGWRVPGWRPVPGTADYATGYVYRPADPELQGSWSSIDDAGPVSFAGDETTREEHGVTRLAERVAAFRAHADLDAVEVRPASTEALAANVVRWSATRLGRGQVMLVEVQPAADPAPGGVAVEVWARAAGGTASVRRGPGIVLGCSSGC